MAVSLFWINVSILCWYPFLYVHMYLIATTALYVMLEGLDYTADLECMFQTFHNLLQVVLLWCWCYGNHCLLANTWLIAKCLERMSQWHKMYYHDQKFKGSNPIWVNLMVRSTWFKHILLVNTKGLGVAKLWCKPSPEYYFCHIRA